MPGARVNQILTGSDGYDAVAHLLAENFFGTGDTVRLVANGVPGYPGLSGDYTAVGYDDSAWPAKQLPVFSQDWVDDFGYAPPPPGTAVPVGAVGDPNDGHWVARFTVDFPDYTVPPDQTDSVFVTGDEAGRKVYLLSLTTQNDGDVWIDGEQVIVSNSAPFGSADYTNCYAVSTTPGEHLVVIDHSGGNTGTQWVGCEWNIPAPLEVDLTVPTTETGDIVVALHNGRLASDGDDFPFHQFTLFRPGASPTSHNPATSASREADWTFAAVGFGDYHLRVIEPTWTLDRFFTVPAVAVLAPLVFDMLAQTTVGARLVLPLHLPNPGVVPDGVLPGAPPSGPLTPSVPGDHYADPIVLTGSSGELTFDVTGAGVDDPDENYWADGHTIWFRWVAPVDGTASFDTAATPPPRWDCTVTAYVDAPGLPMSNDRVIDTEDDNFLQPGVTTDDGYGTAMATFVCVAGVTYWIQVDSYDYPASGTNPSSGYPRSDCVLRWSVT